jgi:hypothetical protein
LKRKPIKTIYFIILVDNETLLKILLLISSNNVASKRCTFGIFYSTLFNTASSAAPSTPLDRRMLGLNPVLVFLNNILWLGTEKEQGYRTGPPEPEFLIFKKPRNRPRESVPPDYVAWRGRYDNPIPTRFLAPIDCLKIPAQAT